MRSLIIGFILLMSFAAHAENTNSEKLFSDLKATSWVGSFHFEVFRPSLGGGKKTMTRKSEEYAIDVNFTDSLTEDGQISYYFSKETDEAKSFDKFVFENIDVQACPGEPRLVEVTGQNLDSSFAGIVHAPECKGKTKTVKDLHIESIKREGDQLYIILADKAIGELVTFKVIYKFQRLIRADEE